MFRRLPDSGAGSVEILLDGEPVAVPAGISVAAAIFYLDALPTRYSEAGGSPRAPYCLIGACFECRLEIDGIAGQRACLVEVAAGMRVRRQFPRPAGEAGS